MNKRPQLRNRLKKESQTVIRFGLIGIAATIVHLGVAYVGLALGWSVFAANVVAFCVAVGVSFSGNYYWTFSKPGSPRRAILRFLVVSCSGFALNNVILVTLRFFDVTDSLAVTIAVLAVPAYSFLGSRLWAFKPSY